MSTTIEDLDLVGRNGIRQAAFKIEHACALGAILFQLAVVDRFHFAAMPAGAVVVQMGHQAQAVFLEGQRAVGVQDIGLFSAALRNSPTTSFLGPMFTAFQRVCLEFHMSKLSWCTPMLKKYFAPAFW